MPGNASTSFVTGKKTDKKVGNASTSFVTGNNEEKKVGNASTSFVTGESRDQIGCEQNFLHQIKVRASFKRAIKIINAHWGDKIKTEIIQ